MNHKPLNPPDGGTIRIHELLNGLRASGHNVRFAYWGAHSDGTSVQDTGVPKPASSAMMKFAEKLYRGREGAAAIDLMTCVHPSLLRGITGQIKEAEILQAEQIWSAPLPLAYGRVVNKIRILDEHNCEALLARRLASHVKNPGVYSNWITYVTALERICCSLADTIVATSDDDRESLARLHGISLNKIEVIPNGSDIKKYHPDPEAGARARRSLGIGPSTPVLTYVGRYPYPPNRLAIEYIQETLAPELWKSHPDAVFLIVSRQVPKGRLLKDPRILEVTDLDDFPYVNAADVCLAPLQVGGGTRIKLMNYMACGKAVVSSPIGCEGIKVRDGRELVVSSMEEFPARVRDLLGDRRLIAELGVNARRFVETAHSWASTARSFERLHQKLLSTNGN